MNSPSAAYQQDASQQKNVVLFQFWDSDIPDEVAALTEGVAKTNPVMDYVFFDDASASDFIKDQFGADVLKLYNCCAIPAMRADLFRYCYLEKCGGFYVDADFPAVASLAPIVQSDWQGCLYLREKGLTNSLMFFRDAGHPLAGKFLELALEKIRKRTSNNVWEVTGPLVIREVYEDKANAGYLEGIHLMPEEEFSLYFKPSPNLGYKSNDSHWLIARQKGLTIYRD